MITKRLALAALAGIFTSTVTAAAAAMPAASQETNASAISSSKCTVYYILDVDPLNIRGRVRPVIVPLNENDRGKHDFRGQRTVVMAVAPDCPIDVFCTFKGNSDRSSPFGRNHVLEGPVENVTSVECGPLVKFADEDDVEIKVDRYGRDSEGENIFRQYTGEKDALEFYQGNDEIEESSSRNSI